MRNETNTCWATLGYNTLLIRGAHTFYLRHSTVHSTATNAAATY